MNDLSFTQEYLLCALNQKGTLPMLKSADITVCLAAGALLELMYSGVISMDKKEKITIERNLNNSERHLEPIFNTIQNSKSINVKNLASKYAFGTGRMLNELIRSLAVDMAEKNKLEIRQGGLFGNKTLYVPDPQEVLKVIEKIRAEFLEEGAVSDDTLVLGALLHKSGLIKAYFSKYEADRLKERLNEIKNSEAGSFVKELVDYIDALVAVMISVGSSAGN